MADTPNDPNAPTVANGTFDPFIYQPTAYVPYWHQDLELAFICAFNALTLILIVSRVVYRRRRLGRFRKDDIWLMVAGFLLVCPLWVCQIGTNRYGSGLHIWNAPDSWIIPFFHFESGWVGYYLVSSLIKISVLYGFLEIIPPAFPKMRAFVHVLGFCIFGLGLAEATVWIFQCQPFLANFIYDMVSTWCVDLDSARYSWVGLSVLFDLCIVSIPFAIIRQIRLKPHERPILLAVFGANLLGTMACAFGAYGVYVNNNLAAEYDDSYTESIYVMTNDVEIFLYTVGASASMASRFFLSKAEQYSYNARGSRGSDWRNEISWPTSNESYYTHTTPTPSSPAKGPRPFGSFGLKRGFKGSDVEILEGFDLQSSPRSWSAQTPRSGMPLLLQEKSQGLGINTRPVLAVNTRNILQSPAPATMTPVLMDVGGLVRTSPTSAPRRQMTDPLRAAPPSPFERVNWNHARSNTATSPDALHAEPQEPRGPINGWNV